MTLSYWVKRRERESSKPKGFVERRERETKDKQLKNHSPRSGSKHEGIHARRSKAEGSSPSEDTTHWILQQRKDVDKIFAPKIYYDKEYDILSVVWFPQINCKSSLETTKGIVFDLSEKDEVKGIEIFDFKERFMK